MKKILNIIMSLVLVVSLTGCAEFLDRPSKTTLNDENYWSNESFVRLFVNKAYSTYFSGYNSGWGGTTIHDLSFRWTGYEDDTRSNSGKLSDLLVDVPGDNWYRSEGSTWLMRQGGGQAWNFGWVRKWNILIERLDMMKEKGKLNDEAYNHWMGVARFFRGWEYSLLVCSFGDVPYYDKEVGSADLDMQYKARDPRVEVMKKVMEDFDFAMANVRVDDGESYVNRDVVATVASRCMLFEGTWYTYHDGADATSSWTAADAKTFLNKAVEYAGYVINSGRYNFTGTDYRRVFGEQKKTGNETILYRAYDSGLLKHNIASYCNMYESQSRYPTLDLVKAFICVDGQPYQNSTVENKDSWRVQDLVQTRDSRFEAQFWYEPCPRGTAMYSVKFIDRIGAEQGALKAMGGPECDPQYASNTNTNGAPVVRYAETVLNWIEAKAELAANHGGAAVTQADLDKSINALRSRPLDPEAAARGVKKTAPLNINNIPSDPARTSPEEVNTHAGVVKTDLLWEIRRERRMELYAENTRLRDLRRWGKLELLDADNNEDILYGGWIDYSKTMELVRSFNYLTPSNEGILTVMKEDGTKVVYDGTNGADMVGFSVPTNYANRAPFSYRNYLEPICKDVYNQYKNATNAEGVAGTYSIVQNKGWEALTE